MSNDKNTIHNVCNTLSGSKLVDFTISVAGLILAEFPEGLTENNVSEAHSWAYKNASSPNDPRLYVAYHAEDIVKHHVYHPPFAAYNLVMAVYDQFPTEVMSLCNQYN